MKFNISLTACATLNCSTERAAASNIGSLNPDNQDDSNSDGAGSNIWVPISVGITLMGLATTGTVMGLKKYAGTPSEDVALQEDQLEGENEQHGDGDMDN